MAISAADVKKLRDITGAGMMDCKKALSEADGDFAKAEKILKEMGLAAVAKRQDRATENGRVFVKTGNGKAVILSLSCETDFVAKNADFAKLGDDLCSVILEKGYTEINDELTGMVEALIAIIKENMHLVRFTVFDVASDEYAATYIHGNGAVAVLVLFKSDKPEIFKESDVEDLTHNLALHAAAFSPLSCVFLHIQLVSRDLMNLIFIYTGPVADPVPLQIQLFRTAVKRKLIFARNPSKPRCKILNVLCLQLAKRASPISIHKTYYTPGRSVMQPFTHHLEFLQMIGL